MSVWYMGVSKNTGTPKWIVKLMENPIGIDDLGGPLFSETPISQQVVGSCFVSFGFHQYSWDEQDS